MNEATTTWSEANESFSEKVITGRSGWPKQLWLFWSLLGPGILALLGDNDAGGMLSYTVTGATFGISLFLPLICCLAPLTYTVQEMAMRLAVVTQTVYSQLLFNHFGRFWGYFSLSALFLANLMTLMTEFIGMTAGLTMLGLSLPASTSISFVLVVSLAVFTGYWTKERLALLVGAFNIVFLIVAYLSSPNPAEIAKAFTTWNLPLAASSVVMWFIVATIGNAIAPWMIFFQSSAAIDKGLTAKDLSLGRIDTMIGSIAQPIIAIAAILCGAALFGRLHSPETFSPTQIISALAPVTGQWGSTLFGLGLFNAGWLAAVTISLSTAWTISGAFGWARSLNNKIHEAPKFYAIYIGSLLFAAAAILIPNLPFNYISVLTQVIAGILLLPMLIFLILLTNNRSIMGEYSNGRFQRIWNWIIVAVLSAMAIGAGWQALIGG